MKYLKVFNAEDDHVEYYGTDLIKYPNVGAYRENVLTSTEHDRVYYVNVIIFTVDGTEYQAEVGMPWEEWINSDYNTDGYGIYYKDTSIITTSDTNYVVCRGSVYVEPAEEIIHNYNYVTNYDDAPI